MSPSARTDRRRVAECQIDTADGQTDIIQHQIDVFGSGNRPRGSLHLPGRRSVRCPRYAFRQEREHEGESAPHRRSGRSLRPRKRQQASVRARRKVPKVSKIDQRMPERPAQECLAIPLAKAHRTSSRTSGGIFQIGYRQDSSSFLPLPPSSVPGEGESLCSFMPPFPGTGEGLLVVLAALLIKRLTSSAQQVHCHRRNQRARDEVRGHHREDDRLGERGEQELGGAGDEEDRHENDTDRERRNESGKRNLLRAVQNRLTNRLLQRRGCGGYSRSRPWSHRPGYRRRARGRRAS